MSTGLTYKYFTIRNYYIYIALTCISIYLYSQGPSCPRM